MPTGQPSNVPAGQATEMREEASPGAILADERLDTTSGGGGLGGSSAAEALGGADPLGGTASSAAIDTGTSSAGKVEREAQRQSLETMPSTRGRSAGS